MLLTEEHKKSFDTYLNKEVRKKIIGKCRKAGITLTDKQIRNVINGTCPDLHGILIIAIREISLEKVRLKNLKKKMDLLKQQHRKCT